MFYSLLTNIHFFTTPNMLILYSVSDHPYRSDFAAYRFCQFSLMALYFLSRVVQRHWSRVEYAYVSVCVCFFLSLRSLESWNFISLQEFSKTWVEIPFFQKRFAFAPPSWLYKHPGSTLIKILLFQFFRYR